MTSQLFVNNARSYLSSDITVDSTSITIDNPSSFVGLGSSNFMRITLDQNGQIEIITATGLTGNTLTGITRGTEGTSRYGFVKGARVEGRITAATLNSFVNEVIGDEIGIHVDRINGKATVSYIGTPSVSIANGGGVGVLINSPGNFTLTNTGVTGINGKTGAIALTEGTGITLTSVDEHTLRIDSSGGGGGGAGSNTRHEWTHASTGTDTYTLTYIVGYLDVYCNGIKREESSFTATSGTSFSLSANASDKIFATCTAMGTPGAAGSGGIVSNRWAPSSGSTLSSFSLNYDTNTLEVFKNGNLLDGSMDWVSIGTGPCTGFTLSIPAVYGDVIYAYGSLSSSGGGGGGYPAITSPDSSVTITGSGTAAVTLEAQKLTAASASTSGYLTSTDWSAFHAATLVNSAQLFKTSTTWTCPTGVTSILVSGVGGGGGGGTGSGDAGGGGGSGYTTIRQLVSVTPGTVYTITIGQGGTGGSGWNTAGSSGTVTSLGSLVTLGGGAGGGQRSYGGSVYAYTGGYGGGPGGDGYYSIGITPYPALPGSLFGESPAKNLSTGVYYSGTYGGDSGTGTYGGGGGGGYGGGTGGTYGGAAATPGRNNTGGGGGGADGFSTTAPVGGSGMLIIEIPGVVL